MADYEFITTTGVIVPDTADILADVQDEYRNALGLDLIVTPDTPQGVLITAETLARDAVVRNNAALANQINPNLAGGIFLDAIMALTGTQRDVATPSTVTATLAGVPGTTIPAGVRAATAAGDEFELTTAVLLPAGGTIEGLFQSVELGPIPAIAAALNVIVDGVLGWETVTNMVGAVLGSETQSDQGARMYRKNTLALQGVSLAEAITSELYAIEGVRSLTFRENVTNGALVIDGINLVAHSIWACVDGGTDLAVAQAIRRAKSAGANYNGAVVVPVTDEFSGQTQNVKFDRPDPIAINAEVTIRSSGSVADPVAAVKEAIVAYAAGLQDGEPGFTVGTDVSSWELGGAVNRATPSIFIVGIRIKKSSGGAYSPDTIVIALDEIATITSGLIDVIQV